jgi:hypothetical protein
LVSRTSFLVKKKKYRTGTLQKISQKNIYQVVLSGSEIRDPEKIHPGAGSRG